MLTIAHAIMTDADTAFVALDPGGTTGWAAFTNGEYVSGQIDTDQHHYKLYQLLGRFYVGYPKLVIICESFEFRQGDASFRMGVNLISREYIGVAKLFAQSMEGVEFYLQTAATAKKFVTDDKLKVMDLWPTGQQHARDAYRHLVTHLVQKRKKFDLVQSWREL